ncbi:hypothetical protein NADFUDRAFT_41186 [Nadsonia fulvescens var. elongata DSM 6958]|uniref:Survival Motor Neuron Gemin2-binding domain-containing protein n=1 Tax=Nadsonia fulvescens var. elongata DSM 6958 TaxID=857566 RepID=A0A1E3PNW6_9ASCO|nr:hypothetical protein NADFUDRAFT_41186 [Nadsonia fulvescens var. elongata DSM 6958]
MDRKQQDIWDDSQLVKHWDNAFAEYKKYHSIEALENKAKRQKLTVTSKSFDDTSPVKEAKYAEMVDENNASTDKTVIVDPVTTDKLMKDESTPSLEYSAMVGKNNISMSLEGDSSENMSQTMIEAVGEQTLQEVDYNTNIIESEPELDTLPNIEINLVSSGPSSKSIPMMNSLSTTPIETKPAISTSGSLPPLDNLDEPLKNLVMSWYWAGYYHGLHVGKNEKNN